jgi:hypothetical protein
MKNIIKYFSMLDLTKRWDQDYDYVLKILQDNTVSVFSAGAPIYSDGSIDIDKIFIEDTKIYLLEKLCDISHNKLKPKTMELPKGH